jgi:EcoRII C terminal
MAKEIKPLKSTSRNALFASTTVHIPKAETLIEEAIAIALRGINDEKTYIKQNFSALIFDLQIEAYKLYQMHEREYGGRALREAFVSRIGANPSAEDVLSNLQSSFNLLDTYFLSLTQGRRTRAGASFQLAMSALLTRLGYAYEAQPVLPDSKPDYVLPNKNWYMQNASDCIILTLKRTLRERWRQVPTEGNTGSTYFLATIDPKVQVDELAKMKTLNVKLVVPKKFKFEQYSIAKNVISFEDFFEDYLDPAVIRWKKSGAA